MDWARRFEQQARWTAQVRRTYFEQIQVAAGSRVLEVGCGPGVILADGPLVPEQFRYGVDIDLPALRQARSRLPAAPLTACDGLHLPFAGEQFDITFCHYYLLWVDAQAALLEMRRVTRPGGWLLALAEPDYTARIDYPPPLDELGRQQTAALQAQGAHPQSGRSLGQLLAECGLKAITSGVLGGQWPAQMDPAEFDQEWQVLEHDLAGRLPHADLVAYRNRDYAARQRGERVLYVPTFFAAGQV